MKTLYLVVALASVSFAGGAFAQADAAAGEKDFKKCKACHTITNGNDVIVKGGKVGPNLYGVVGRVAGSADYKYSKSMVAAGEAGLIWTEETIIAFIADPKAFLKDFLNDPKAKSKMTLKMKDGADVAAFLASVSPEVESDAEDQGEESEENSDS